MKLLTEKEIKEMAKEFSETNYEHPELKSCSKHSYINGVKDLLESASEGFEEWELRLINDNGGIIPDFIEPEELWQAFSLSHAKKMQEKDYLILSQEKERQRTEAFWKEKLSEIQDMKDAELESLKKENREMREALREANELIDVVSEDVTYMDQEPSSLAEWANRYRTKFPSSETPNSSKKVEG